MASRKSGFGRAFGVLLCAALAVGAVAAPQTLSLTVNGKTAQRVPVLMNGTRVMVGVEGVAAGFSLPVHRTTNTASLQVQGSQLTLTDGDVVVRQGTAAIMHLTASPEVRSGQFFVDTADLPALFDVDVDVQPAGLTLTSTSRPVDPKDGSGGFHTKDVPTPRPTVNPHPNNPNEPAADGSAIRSIGHATGSLNTSGGSRSFSMGVQAAGDKATTNVYANGSNGQTTTFGGTMRFGMGQKHVAFGSITDPMQGIAFTGGNDTGIEIGNASGLMLASALRQVDLRNITALSHQSNNLTESLAVEAKHGKFEQALLGLRKTTSFGSGSIGRELWVGDHGIAGGLSLQTSGRLFADFAVGFAGAGLLVNPGDAPLRLNAGYRLSPAVTLIGNVNSGIGRFGTASGGFLIQRPNLQFSLTRFSTATSVDLGLSGPNKSADFLVTSGVGQESMNSRVVLPLGQGALNMLASFATGGSQDDLLSMQFKREGTSPILGVEHVRSGDSSRIGPVVGLSFPLGSLLRISAAIHPLTNGNGLQVNLDQTLQYTSRPRFNVENLSLAGTSASPLFVYLDGIQNQPVSIGAATLKIPRGSHYLSVQSADKLLATQAVRVTDVGPKSVALQLWPFRTVKGGVQVEGATAVNGAQTPLGAITVRLQPGDYVAQTDANGNFEFPPTPLAPNTTISVDSDTVSSDLAAGEAQPLPADGPVIVLLHPSKKLEKVTF